MVRGTVLTLAVAALAVAGLLPVLLMVGRSVLVDGQLSFAYYKTLLRTPAQWELIANSLTLSSLTALFALLVGVPLGVLLGKTDLPLRQALVVLFTVPLLLPPYITAVSWFDLLGRQGLLADIAGTSLTEVTSRWLFGLPGCVLVLCATFLPIVILLTITFLRAVHPRLEEAGRLICPWPRVLRGITLPLILPGVLLAGLLVFLLSLGEFGVPMFLRYNVFPVETFTQFSAFYNFGAAVAAAMPLLAITLVALAVERLFLRRKTYRPLAATAGKAWPIVSLGRLRPWLFAVTCLLACALVIVPYVALVVRSLSPGAYPEALRRASDSLWRSLGYAALGATAATLVGFPLGYLVNTRALRWWLSADSLSIFLFALPSTVIGIGLISLWNRPQTAFIYATPAIIILGYVARYTALASRISLCALAHIPPSMEEAAQVAGAGWLRRVTLIVVPLAARGIAAAWLVGYIFCLRDTGLTMMVYPPGHDTLPVRIFTLMANGPPDLIAALCVIMVLAALVPLGLLWLVLRLGARAK